MNLQENAEKTWAFGRKLGMTKVQAAAYVGHCQGESGLDPTSVEGIFGEPYSLGPRKSAAASSIPSVGMNSWFASLASDYASQGISINHAAYGISGGSYCVGIGLLQYTGPQAEKLVNFAKSHKGNWYDLSVQLAYMCVGFNAGLKASINDAGSKTSIETAVAWFLGTIGMGGLAPRYDLNYSVKVINAHNWYNQFSSRSDELEKKHKKFVEAAYKMYTGNGKAVHDVLGGTSSTEGSGLFVSPEKLYSSNNYSYVKSVVEQSAAEKLFENLKTSTIDQIKQLLQDVSKGKQFGSIVSSVVKDVVLRKTNAPATQVVSKTIVSGSTTTSVLPVITALVEAPYFEVEMAGVKFGGYHNNRIPNYVRSLTVKKTNGNVNEYTIQLIHQISPGDNPNFIDKVLSATGYNTISIQYGNANTGQIVRDTGALITSVTQNFDFTNCNILYTISATSLSSTVSYVKRNFEEFEGKVSDKIRKLLWNDPNGELLSIFPGMKDQLAVEKAGLIPSNDKIVKIGACENITVMEYLAILVGRMENASSGSKDIVDSVYTFVIDDDSSGSKFKIAEVKNNSESVPYMYEVNIGYPDDNFVLNFNVNSNFAWALAYNGTKDIVKYDYDLDSKGNLTAQRIPAAYKNRDDVIGNRLLWTSLTRYPVSATLTIRGLTKDSLLLQYIKINSIMYGAKRITSGVYIVLEQTDSIGNGIYSTTLSLLRVSGDDEYINLDGRKII